MKYIATIIENGISTSKEFATIFEAANWLDAQNNNLEATTTIETFDETGQKLDGFFYKERR